MAVAENAIETAGGAALAPSMRGAGRLHAGIFIALALALLVAPFMLYPVFLVKVLCFALFACAFNLLLGYGGLLSFGHAAYFGFASYVAAYTLKNGLTSLPFWLPGIKWFDIPVGLPPFTPELAIILGVCVSALLGLAFGSLAIKRQGIYFAMITLALAQLVYFYALQAPFTGGEDGIQSVPRGRLFGFIDLSNDATLYYFVAVIFLAGLLLIYRIIHSPFGQVLKAIRDNEPRAISLGYDVNRYKLTVFVLSAALAGLAGATKAVSIQLASLTDVHWSMSGEVVLMTLVGGMGTIFGPIIGASVIVTMQNYLAGLGVISLTFGGQTFLLDLGGWVTIVQGIIFVLCVLLFREGIVGVIGKKLRLPL